MFNTTLKRISWLCLFSVVIVGGLFTVNIVVPSLSTPRPSTPYLSFHLKPQRIGSLAFTPDGKLLLCTYYINGISEIKRWNISDGRELFPIQDKNIHLLTNDGQFYVTYDFVKNQNINQRETNQRLRRTSDQSIVATLPDNTKARYLMKIIGGEHPFAIYFYSENELANQRYYLTRRYFMWDIKAKHFVTNTPHTNKLYIFPYRTSKDIVFSEDGAKILSLWPTYTQTLPPSDPQITSNKTITVTKNFTPLYDPNYRREPKEATLLNEIDGSITKLPLPEKSLNFEFGWINPSLSANQKYFAAASAAFPGGWIQNGKDGTIWCYDLPNHKLKWKYPPKNNLPDLLRFSPDGTMLAAGGGDRDYRVNGIGFLNVIDVETGKLLHSYTEQTLIQQIRDRTRIYSLEMLRRFAFRFRRFEKVKQWRQSISSSMDSPPALGNSGHVKHIAWSPDSKMLAAAYRDGSVKLWRVKE